MLQSGGFQNRTGSGSAVVPVICCSGGRGGGGGSRSRRRRVVAEAVLILQWAFSGSSQGCTLRHSCMRLPWEFSIL